MKEYNLKVPHNKLNGEYTFYRKENIPISLIGYFLVHGGHVQLVEAYTIPERSALNRSDQ